MTTGAADSFGKMVGWFGPQKCEGVGLEERRSLRGNTMAASNQDEELK